MNPVQAGSTFSSSITASTSAWVAVAGRSRRIEVMPIEAQSLCLAPTYQWEPGSSPTRTVPRPGVTPRSRSAATRSASSALIVRSVAVPSSIRAVIGAGPLSVDESVGGSVEEVAGTGGIHRDAGVLAGLDRQLVAHRAPWLDDGADAGIDQDLGTVLEREERIGCGDRARGPLPGSRDRQAA